MTVLSEISLGSSAMTCFFIHPWLGVEILFPMNPC